MTTARQKENKLLVEQILNMNTVHILTFHVSMASYDHSEPIAVICLLIFLATGNEWIVTRQIVRGQKYLTTTEPAK